MMKENLSEKKAVFGLVRCEAVGDIGALSESAKKNIKIALKNGVSIRLLEATTIACLGNEVWRLKNIGRDKHKWLLVRVSDGLSYPITI